MASAVVAAMVLTILLPDAVRLGPQWLLPLIEGVLLVAVIASDLGHTLSNTEALLGQLYLVTVVAVLVSRMARGRDH